MSVSELVTLFHFPPPSVRSKKMVFNATNDIPVPSSLKGHQTILDTNSYLGKDTPVTVSTQHRLRHMHIIGATGAGKSTFLRQNALITILAQMGSYVPAESAHIGIVDRLFSRVGAADDLARGQSTFMVEMVETATILNQATERSLVILDEIGRGTATFDGLSIAWACVEQLHEVNKSRALFATHYHELTTLQNRLDCLHCYSLQVKEWKGDIVFTHNVVEGSADKSYGIHVAKIAGLPTAVINRAQEVLKRLSADKNSSDYIESSLPLFTAQPTVEQTISFPSKVEELLKDTTPDDLSPREALETLYTLKKLLEN